MPVPNKITPEEKLLHIIENTKKNKNTVSPGGTGRSFFNSIDFRSLIGIVKIDPKHLTLRDLNKVLIFVAVIFTLFAFSYLSGEKRFIQDRLSNMRNIEIKKDPLSIDLNNGNKLDASSYVAGTLSKNPFHMLPVDTEPVDKKVVETKEFTLVGILWSDRAQAIIEDPVTNKTYMVYEGDTIDEYKIDEITQTEVKLTSQYGEKILR